eukprot:Clim_evm21s197 gene=Clim_evmTU21s197
MRMGRIKFPDYINTKDKPSDYYKVLELLGEGSFGRVYKGKRLSDDLEVALKTIKVQEESEKETFQVEIQILKKARHSHVIGLYEAFFYKHQFLLVLELCDGAAVEEIYQELGRGFTEEQIACCMRQTLHGLQYLHEQNIIHRDIKGGNILVDSKGVAKLTDFGVSALLEPGQTHRSTFIGTPHWMAPEVCYCEHKSNAKYEAKSDIWSLGITCIELAETEPPMNRLHPMRAIYRIVSLPPPGLSEAAKWSRDFQNFVAKCLVKDPSLRSGTSQLRSHPFVKGDIDDTKVLKMLVREYLSPVEDVEVSEAEYAEFARRENQAKDQREEDIYDRLKQTIVEAKVGGGTVVSDGGSSVEKRPLPQMPQPVPAYRPPGITAGSTESIPDSPATSTTNLCMSEVEAPYAPRLSEDSLVSSSRDSIPMATPQPPPRSTKPPPRPPKEGTLSRSQPSLGHVDSGSDMTIPALPPKPQVPALPPRSDRATSENQLEPVSSITGRDRAVSEPPKIEIDIREGPGPRLPKNPNFPSSHLLTADQRGMSNTSVYSFADEYERIRQRGIAVSNESLMGSHAALNATPGQEEDMVITDDTPSVPSRQSKPVPPSRESAARRQLANLMLDSDERDETMETNGDNAAPEDDVYNVPPRTSTSTVDTEDGVGELPPRGPKALEKFKIRDRSHSSVSVDASLVAVDDEALESEDGSEGGQSSRREPMRVPRAKKGGGGGEKASAFGTRIKQRQVATEDGRKFNVLSAFTAKDLREEAFKKFFKNQQNQFKNMLRQERQELQALQSKQETDMENLREKHKAERENTLDAFDKQVKVLKKTQEEELKSAQKEMSQKMAKFSKSHKDNAKKAEFGVELMQKVNDMETQHKGTLDLINKQRDKVQEDQMSRQLQEIHRLKYHHLEQEMSLMAEHLQARNNIEIKRHEERSQDLHQALAREHREEIKVLPKILKAEFKERNKEYELKRAKKISVLKKQGQSKSEIKEIIKAEDSRFIQQEKEREDKLIKFMHKRQKQDIQKQEADDHEDLKELKAVFEQRQEGLEETKADRTKALQEQCEVEMSELAAQFSEAT